MYNYNPLDVDISTHQSCAIRLIEDLKLHIYAYCWVDPNPAIIEYMFLHQSPERIICKQCVGQSYFYKVFYGSVLLSTLDYYVVQDNTFEGLKFFPEFNGQRISQLAGQWRRYINQCMISITVDRSLKEDNSIIESYLETLKGYSEG